MLSRKEQLTPGKEMPKQWSDELCNLLNTTYSQQCCNLAKKFEVYGLTYPDELFLAISLLDKDDLNTAPITYLLSTDLSKSQNPTKILDHLVDSIGLFFEHYFQLPEEDHYQGAWQESHIKNINFFYRISRENIALTLQANRLLEKED